MSLNRQKIKYYSVDKNVTRGSKESNPVFPKGEIIPTLLIHCL